ncbi:hypothetical protein M758_10G175000 [Ceratodon purpureus]|nr:hypothetical protein M758_10G175000 [Ceratodon purpureus]
MSSVVSTALQYPQTLSLVDGGRIKDCLDLHCSIVSWRLMYTIPHWRFLFFILTELDTLPSAFTRQC